MDDAGRARLGGRQRLAPEDVRRRCVVRPDTDRGGADERHGAQRELDRPTIVGAEHAASERPRLDRPERLLRPRRRECRKIDAEPADPAALRLDVGGLEQRIELPRQDMQRPAHHARLHDAPVDQGVRQRALAEPFDTRPEREIRRRRVLRLQRDEPSDGPSDRQPHAPEQQLAAEQRPVQLTGGERPQGTTAAFSRSGGGSANSAGRSSSSTRCVISRSHG